MTPAPAVAHAAAKTVPAFIVTGAETVFVAIGVIVISSLIFRFVRDLTPWLGAWTYALQPARLVVRCRIFGLPVGTHRIPISSIASVTIRGFEPKRVTVPGAKRGPGGASRATVPVPTFHIGRQRMLGSYGAKTLIELKPRGPFAKQLIVITPPEADAAALARDLQRAVAEGQAATARAT